MVILLDLRSKKITGKELEHRLDEIYITANKNAIPADPEGPFITSGIRLGTAAITSRGFVKEDMREIASLISAAAEENFADNVDALRARVDALCAKYPLYNEA